MPGRTRAASGFAILAAVLAPALACADVYVWIDGAGTTHVSNVTPPEGARVVSVTRSPPPDPARDAALREARQQAEMRALDERVRQLQADVERARRDAVPAVVVQPPAPLAPPPAPSIVVVMVPPPSPQYAAGCDGTWGPCGIGFWPGFYPSGVVVVHDRHVRHRHPGHPGWGRGSRPIGHPPFPGRGPGPRPK
jgi:hypothetical protein